MDLTRRYEHVVVEWIQCVHYAAIREMQGRSVVRLREIWPILVELNNPRVDIAALSSALLATGERKFMDLAHFQQSLLRFSEGDVISSNDIPTMGDIQSLYEMVQS
jgi:hypothetical protein